MAGRRKSPSVTIDATYTPDKKNEAVSATVILTSSNGKQEIALSGTYK